MTAPRSLRAFLAALACVLALAGPGHAVEEGFGAGTPGGSEYPVVRVTTLDDFGPGSLREALAEGYRTVVFDVAGDIVPATHLYVRGPFVTIDGTTAPAPGITLRGKGLVIRDVHDVIVRGLRFRDTWGDGITVTDNAHDILISHVSCHGSGDGNIDITFDSHDVTVAWSILAAPASQKGMLIKYGASRVTLHHNLFVASHSRNPAAAVDDQGTPATDTTVDMRNNVVWDWGKGHGTLIHYGAAANVVANYYASPQSSGSKKRNAVIVCAPDCFENDPDAAARAWVAENVSGDGAPVTAVINAENTEIEPFPAPPVTTSDACTAAADVLNEAGVRPLDDVDAWYVSQVTLAGC